MREQSYASIQRGLPVDRTDESQKKVSYADTVAFKYYNAGSWDTDSGQAIASLIVGPLTYGSIANKFGDVVGNINDTSLSFTFAALDTEVAIDYSVLEQLEGTKKTTLQKVQAITAGFANGEYCVDYTKGVIYGKKKTTASGAAVSISYKILSNASQVTLETGDIEIGSVELKDADSDVRANIKAANTARTTATVVVATQNVDAAGLVKNVEIDDAAYTPASSQVDVIGGTVTNDNVDQADKGALAMTLDRRLKVDADNFGDGFGTYSNRRGDFTATITNGAKTITVTGLPFTLEAGHVQAITKVDSSGNKYTMPNTNITVSGGVITVTDMPSAGFVTGDTVSVLLVGSTKTYDRTLDVQKTVDQSPVNQQYVEESIADTTNVADGTYYPSSTGMPYGGYKNLSLSGSLIDGAAETTTLTVEVTDDEDTTNASWIQVYGYDAKNNTVVNSQAATNQTTTYAWDFDNFNYRHLRFKIAATAATNTVIIKCRRSY